MVICAHLASVAVNVEPENWLWTLPDVPICGMEWTCPKGCSVTGWDWVGRAHWAWSHRSILSISSQLIFPGKCLMKWYTLQKSLWSSFLHSVCVVFGQHSEPSIPSSVSETSTASQTSSLESSGLEAHLGIDPTVWYWLSTDWPVNANLALEKPLIATNC